MDIKPVGIFYLIAGYLRVFGDSIFLFRLFTAIVISLTAFLLYQSKKAMKYSGGSAFASGFIYIAFLSIWTHFGAGANTEHFFNLFTALSLLLVLKKDSLFHIWIASFLLGIGFLIKIVVAFDFGTR